MTWGLLFPKENLTEAYMERYRVALIVVALTIGQVVHSYIQADTVRDHALEWRALKERHMAESGVAPELRAHITSGDEFATSLAMRYTRSVTETSILVNAALLLVVFYESRRRAHAQGGEG